MIKKVGFVFVFLLLAFPARADEFIKPTFSSVLQTMLRMSAMTLTEDAVLDDYAIVTECPLYKSFYSDDFKWNKVRAAIRDSVQKNMPTFPTAYYYGAQLQLDRYDFNDRLFRFTDKTAINNVNAFGLFKTIMGDCPNAPTKHIPTIYNAVLDAPISLAGLPLGPEDAKALLQTMKDNKNFDRIIYAKFNMHVVYIEPLHPDYKTNVQGGFYAQPTGTNDPHMVRFDAVLDSVDFYEDEAMTKLIYSYKS